MSGNGASDSTHAGGAAAQGDNDQKRKHKDSIDHSQTLLYKMVRPGKHAFLSDDEVGHSFVWRAAEFLFWYMNQWLHRLSFVGAEKLDPEKGMLSVHVHSTHNQDIAYILQGTYQAFGKVSRGLVHRTVMGLAPWLQYIGMVPGYRDTAEKLLRNNFWVAVIPGGGEEAMRGHENAYNLNWPKKRKGFAKVAIRAGVPIVPIFYQNHEEMRFNPIFWLWNQLHGSVPFDFLVNAKIPILSATVKFLGEATWFLLTWVFSIPMPAKVTAYIGNEIKCTPDSDINEVVKQTYDEIKRLIKEHQPNGIDRRRAYRMWKEDRAKYGDWRNRPIKESVSKKKS